MIAQGINKPTEHIKFLTNTNACQYIPITNSNTHFTGNLENRHDAFQIASSIVESKITVARPMKRQDFGDVLANLEKRFSPYRRRQK